MEKGYFAASWADVTKSPGWLSKLVRLGLLCLVPIFGAIVANGYLYAWARDIAWNVHRPLPDRIFGNEDGNLYKRGFFIILIGFVFSLAPGILYFVGGFISGVFVMSSSVPWGYTSMGALIASMVFSLLSLVLAFAVTFFYWVGAMRTSIYGSLSAGFQLGKIWAMIRYDFTGLLRIFGMSLLCGLVLGFAIGIATMIFVLFFIAGSFAFASSTGMSMVGVAICMLVIGALCVFSIVGGVIVEALIARALGYWTRQFEVSQWGGQEDPLPFERRAAQMGTAPYAAGQAYGQPGYGQPGYGQPGAWPQTGAQQAPFQQAGYGQATSQVCPFEQAPYQTAQGVPVQQAPYQPEQGIPVQQAPYAAPEVPVRPGPEAADEPHEAEPPIIEVAPTATVDAAVEPVASADDPASTEDAAEPTSQGEAGEAPSDDAQPDGKRADGPTGGVSI